MRGPEKGSRAIAGARIDVDTLIQQSANLLLVLVADSFDEPYINGSGRHACHNR
jgi:hypothetical protein